LRENGRAAEQSAALFLNSEGYIRITFIRKNQEKPAVKKYRKKVEKN